MFNFATICESVKRHWVVIAIIAVLSLCAGVASSFTKDEAAPSPVNYTAESSLYLTAYGYGDKESGEYNYSLSEGYMVTDARRLVVSSEVAGAVRAKYGEDVVVSSPVWMNDVKNSEYSTRFVYIDVTASDPETAKAACELATQLTKEAVMKTLPLESAEIAEPAALKSGGNTKAANWGADAFPGEKPSPIETAVEGISAKKVFIFTFVGLALSIVGFAAYDILSRRVRSVKDIERLLDLPVLATLADGKDSDRLAQSVAVLMKRSDLKTLAVAGASKADGASAVSKAIEDSKAVSVTSSVDLSDSVDAASRILGADTVLLVLKEGASRGSELECALKQLRIAGVPVLGAVFVPKKSKKRAAHQN